MSLLTKIVSVLLLTWVCNSQNATFEPSSEPSYSPSNISTNEPSSIPTISPTSSPSFFPSAYPTAVPTAPTISPSVSPTKVPTKTPSATPTKVPTTIPTVAPTSSPSVSPTVDYVATCSALFPNYCHFPTPSPTSPPTNIPTSLPSSIPTAIPTTIPTSKPSAIPTSIPTVYPTAYPSSKPTYSPTPLPTSQTDFIKNTCLTTPFCTGNYSTKGFSDLTTPANVFLKILCLEQSYCILPTPNPTSAPTFLPSSIPTLLPTPYPNAPTPTPTIKPTIAPTILRQWYQFYIGYFPNLYGNTAQVATSYNGNAIYLASPYGSYFSLNYGESFTSSSADYQMAANSNLSVVYGLGFNTLYKKMPLTSQIYNIRTATDYYIKDFLSISCDLNCNIVAAIVGSYSVIENPSLYYSVDSGATFNTVNITIYNYALGGLISAKVTGQLQFLAFSQSDMLKSSVNNPASWTLLKHFPTGSFRSCVADASLSYIYCVLYTSEYINYSHDGGYTFGNSGQASSWVSVATDLSGQYVYSAAANPTLQIYLSSDYGITVNLLKTISSSSSFSFLSVSGNNAVLYAGTNDGYVYRYSA